MLQYYLHYGDEQLEAMESVVYKLEQLLQKILLKKLFKSTSPELQLNYARYFIKCGNIFGLQFLVKYIEREKKTPFSDYIRNTELRLETPLAIPLLLRLFDFAYDKSIPQDSFDRVSNFARQMLQHLAFCQHGKYFPLIINALQEHLMINKWAIEFGNSNVNWFEAANPEGLKEIQSFAKDLEFQHFQKQEVLTEDALELFEKF